MRGQSIREFLGVVLSSTVIGLMVFGLRMPNAEASCFSGEQADFVGNFAVSNAYGSTNWFQIRDRNLDTSCSNPVAVSTAQLGDATGDNQVEMGWWEDLSGGQHRFRYFWEAQHGSVTYGGCCDSGTDITSHVGESWGWRVAFHGSDNNFHWYIDSGSGFTEIIPPGIGWQVVGFQHGNPKGETNRRGGTGTGAKDDHYNSTYKSGSTGANWVNWTNNSLQSCNIPGWNYTKVSDTEWTMTTGTC
jgi:hypothetical protein